MATDLVLAARNQDWEKMLELSKKGASVDAEVSDGYNFGGYTRNALKYAVHDADAKVVDELIKAGIENKVDQRIKKGDKGDKNKLMEEEAKKWLNTQDNSGTGLLPISYAVFRGDADIFNVLVKHGADPKKNNRLLCNTARRCRYEGANVKEIARILIEKHGFDVHTCHDTFGDTPLHEAAVYGCDQDFMQVLTSKGAKVNAYNKSAQSPLHKAAGMGSAVAVTALIELGAELEKADNSSPIGFTPLQLAEGKQFEYVAQLLRDAIKEKKSGKQVAGAPKSTTTAGAQATVPGAEKTTSIAARKLALFDWP
ncbi:ankyrin repeats (3 copies) domain-containing protein [Ditylenchus destructor]|uniref:Ankyrin repeats (3 copies) domain-containing protein n=1 Tax=Ditylenchus destructor TaxID=166010 RepID=A0AAD4QZM3_9BILA|nr:ankyrin repeats (3 copies) domain-containing protein [Ditylenchus destructor]